MAVYLEEFVDSIENLPSEIKHHLDEIRIRDEQFHGKKFINEIELRKNIISTQKNFLTKEWNSQTLPDQISEKYQQADILTGEKQMLAEKAIELLNKHIKSLEEKIVSCKKTVDESGIVYIEPSVPPPSPLTRGSFNKKGSRRRHPQFSTRSDMDLDEFDEEEEEEDEEDYEDSGEEPLYCICQQVSFGEMIACDNTDNCPFEWFHYTCVGLTEPPTGVWYCPTCAPRMKKRNK